MTWRKFIIYLALTIFFTACANKPDGHVTITGDEIAGGRPVFKFEYKGHKYIQFGLGNTAWGVHDPDCPCENRNK